MCIKLQKVTREDAEDHVKNGGGAFFLLDKTGDTKQVWDPDNSDEVEAANDLFDKLVQEKHYSAFRVEEDGKKGERMEKFDAKAGKIILVPPMVGG